MDIFTLFTFVGGLAFFLYGISTMSQGLENVAGGKLEQLLKKATANPFKSFLLGAGITAIIQSSSAVTVMLIGLVNSGIMSLSQTVSIIIGANLGTTITAWLLSLTAIKENGGGVILKLLNPETFAPLLAFIGVIFTMKTKNKKRKNLGLVFIGFAILIFGMNIMTVSMQPLAKTSRFQEILISFQNPLLSFFAGIFITAIIQSSSASIGILQALSISSVIPLEIAIPIILGQNLGTCLSAILASIGVNINAKRVAGIHVIYNTLGVIIFFPIFLILSLYFNVSFLQRGITPFEIALFHTGFNFFTAIAVFPFLKAIENIAVKYIHDNNKNLSSNVFLDKRLLLTPTFATSECFRKTLEMGQMVESNLNEASNLIFHYDETKEEKISQNETKIDLYEDKLNSFLVKLSAKGLTDETSNKVSQLLLSISDFERIGDHAINILNIAKKMHE
ncbi:MAG: Na/Pi cotransporter family protein, partial [Bdellovibrionota bacterium]|nr:Na/Pi cotransporter family protein [Pseudomonadota bacterium]MDY6089653.1 Na/Pi cotransporter family protein [Bdellovibrionota bacterium]